jgi:hypothetical protein
MKPRNARDLAKEYLELFNKARSWGQKVAILAAHTAKHLRLVTGNRDSLKEVLKAHNVKV